MNKMKGEDMLASSRINEEEKARGRGCRACDFVKMKMERKMKLLSRMAVMKFEMATSVWSNLCKRWIGEIEGEVSVARMSRKKNRKGLGVELFINSRNLEMTMTIFISWNSQNTSEFSKFKIDPSKYQTLFETSRNYWKSYSNTCI